VQHNFITDKRLCCLSSSLIQSDEHRELAKSKYLSDGKNDKRSSVMRRNSIKNVTSSVYNSISYLYRS